MRVGYDFKIIPPETSQDDYKIEYITHCGMGMTLDTFKEQLLYLGIDTRTCFQMRSCIHRSVQTGERQFGIRFGGLEREDQDWLDSGFASKEMIMKMSNFDDMDEVEQELANGNRAGY
jgi:hypothetical protein